MSGLSSSGEGTRLHLSASKGSSPTSTTNREPNVAITLGACCNLTRKASNGIFLDAIASPSTYPCQWVSDW